MVCVFLALYMAEARKTVNILLVDDHAIVIDGIESLLKTLPYIHIVGKASGGKQALQILETEHVDLMITDYSMDDMDGATLIPKVKKLRPDVKIIVLSMHDEPPLVQDVLRSGVNGYILKKHTHHELLMAIEIISEGGQFWSAEVNQMLLRGLKPETNSQITEREMEILKLLTKELTSKDIAEQLFISERTVETHRKNLLRKTNCSSTIGLLNYAYQHKLI